jgi:GABA permease
MSARVLVVANRTAESEELRSALRAKALDRNPEFTLLVPSTPHGISWAVNPHDTGADEAEEHRQAFLDGLRKEGLNVVDAKIGDPDPLAAVQDECNLNEYDELVISTLPTHISKWLKLDLPHKAEHATGLPVTHVVAHSAG